MPVDRFGKLTFRNNPANRYATPINRKPKRRKRFKAIIVILGCFALLVVTNFLWFFIPALYADLTGHPEAPHRYWTPVLAYHGAGSQETADFHVSDTWKLTWNCDSDGYSLTIQPIFGTSGKPVPPVNVNCDTGNLSGTVQMSRGGNVALSVIAQETQGVVTLESWHVSVQDLE